MLALSRSEMGSKTELENPEYGLEFLFSIKLSLKFPEIACLLLHF